MTIPSSQSLIFEVKSTGCELAFICVLSLWRTLVVFGLLWKTSDFFRNLRKWSCRLQKSLHSQDKNLMLKSQKKLAGIRPPWFPEPQPPNKARVLLCYHPKEMYILSKIIISLSVILFHFLKEIEEQLKKRGITKDKDVSEIYLANRLSLYV